MGSLKKITKNAIVAVAIMGTAVVILAIALLASASGFENVDDGRELKLVHVIMRHGARTPASTYPNDPYINETFYPAGWGQLTNAGKLQLYNVGKYLRQRYGKFLGSHFTPDEFYTQSTGVDRTKASMMTVNAGLWPPSKDQKWGPLDWQPIPLNYENLNEDSLLLVRKPCPRYHIERQAVMESEEVKQLLKSYESLFKELTEITGQKVDDLDGVQDIYSTLKAEEGINLKLPEWTRAYYPERMFEPTIQSFILNAYNDKMNRLKGGLLLKKLLSDWTAKAADTITPKTRKAFLYGGHDSTIVNIMRTLKIWDKQFPGYAITVLFELYKDPKTNDYGVEVFLRNSTEVPPFKMTIPGCDSFCPLEKLRELTKNVIPDNWEEECKTEDPNFVVPDLGGP